MKKLSSRIAFFVISLSASNFPVEAGKNQWRIVASVLEELRTRVTPKPQSFSPLSSFYGTRSTGNFDELSQQKIKNRMLFLTGGISTALGAYTYFNIPEPEEYTPSSNPLNLKNLKQQRSSSLSSSLGKENHWFEGRTFGVPFVYASEKPSLKTKRNNASDQEFIDSIREGIEKGEANFKKVARQLDNLKEITILIGSTGSGKSKIADYNNGQKLIAYRDEVDKKIYIETEGEDRKKRRKYKSDTQEPRVVGKWLDCPGMFDSRGKDQEFLNAYFFRRVIDQTPKVRFLVAVSESSFDVGARRGQSFLDLIDLLSKTFPGDSLEKLKNSLNIVVTQGTNEEIGVFKGIIREILSDRREELNSSQIDLLQHISSEENDKITFFKRPTDVGPISKGLKFIKDGADYTEGLHVNLAVSERAVIGLQKIADGITEEITQYLESIENDFQNHVTNYIKADSYEAQIVRTILGDMSDSLKTVRSQEDTLEEDSIKIKEVLTRFRTGLDKPFDELIQRRRVLLDIKPENSGMSLDFNKGGILNNIANSALKFAQPPTAKTINSCGILEGYIVGTSDFVKQFTGSRDISRVDVLCSHALILDSDIHKPGMTLVMTAPWWFVRGERNISLRGRDAVDWNPFQASEGKDGHPGEPGENGGSFYGSAKGIINEGALIIDVSGGTGGKGQNGGDGSKGADGVEGDIEDIKNKKAIKEKEEKVHRGVLNWITTSNDAVRTVYRSGKPAEPGSNAGIGGKGGFGGRFGTIRMHVFDDNLHFNYTEIFVRRKYEGESGKDGSAGEPGSGGKNKKIYEGVFVSKNRNLKELAKRIVAQATAGGLAGYGVGSGVAPVATTLGSIGGPLGAAIAYVGVVGTTTISGVVVGALTPIIGSELADDDYWEKEADQVPIEARAPDGKREEKHKNEEGRKSPPEVFHLDKPAIQQNWKQFYRKTANN